MKNIAVVTFTFPTIPLIDQTPDLTILKLTLTLLMHFTLTNLISKPPLLFKCYISHPADLTDSLNTLLADYPPLPSHIVFTSQFTTTIQNDLDSLGLSSYDFIYFITLNYNTLCHKNFLSTLADYTPHLPIRSLLFTNSSSYNLSNHNLILLPDETLTDFVYACSTNEYKMYFRFYSYYAYTSFLSHFRNFPHENVFNTLSLKLIYPNTILSLPPLEKTLLDPILQPYYF